MTEPSPPAQVESPREFVDRILRLYFRDWVRGHEEWASITGSFEAEVEHHAAAIRADERVRMAAEREGA